MEATVEEIAAADECLRLAYITLVDAEKQLTDRKMRVVMLDNDDVWAKVRAILDLLAQQRHSLDGLRQTLHVMRTHREKHPIK